MLQAVTNIDSLMRRCLCDKLHGALSHLFAFPAVIVSIAHAFDAPVLGGGGRRNIAMTFGTEKLEWCGYPTVKKFDDMFIRFDRIQERDGQTNRHRMTA